MRAQAETGIDGSYGLDADRRRYVLLPPLPGEFAAWLEEYLPKAAARAKYGTTDYGGQPPRRRGDPFWMEWLTFRGHTVAEFHRRLRAMARRYNPDFLISGNVFGGFGYGPIAYDAAGNMEMLAGRLRRFRVLRDPGVSRQCAAQE